VRGVFVSGTDTGVGKTFVSCVLARGLRDEGIDVGVMKPVETGVTSAGPQDAIALRAAAGVDDALELVCPLQFAMPAAPSAAARAEGRPVSTEAIESAFATLKARHEFMLVEGAGGLLVPFDAETTMANLASDLGLPLLLVARTSLGTINHTLMSLEICDQRGLEVLGVVLSHSTGILSEADQANLAILRESLGERLVGEIEAMAAGATVDPESAGIGTLRRQLRDA
jgi:dethiobiotin synthetase